jgi:D-glucuronyl C5-epimerase C-terminus
MESLQRPSLGHVRLQYTVRAIRREVFEFHFNDPYEADFEAGGSDSLRYPIYSDKLTWESMRMDDAGIPRSCTRTTGTNYWPAYIAWYALIALGHYHRGRGSQHLDVFLRQIDWLEENAVWREDGAVVWPMNFDYQEDGTLLRAPWISSHAQGFVISALVRGWRITRRPHIKELLERSSRVFDLNVRHGGIRAEVNGNAFYTEVPGGPVPGILDGFLVSLIGLHDLYIESHDPDVGRLLTDGLGGLRKLLPWWNYRDKWSWYGHRRYLSPPAYHFWNRILLSVLASLTGNADLAVQAARWNPERLSAAERAEVYAVFLATKNRMRIRCRTWRQKTIV